jgi:hypothetical protein
MKNKGPIGSHNNETTNGAFFFLGPFSSSSALRLDSEPVIGDRSAFSLSTFTVFAFTFRSLLKVVRGIETAKGLGSRIKASRLRNPSRSFLGWYEPMTSRES